MSDLALQRGEIYRAIIPLRDKNNDLVLTTKRLVILHDDDKLPHGTDFAFLMYSTDPQKHSLRAFEVGIPNPQAIGLYPAEDFDRPSKVDCRFPRTERRSVLDGAELMGRLPDATMDEIDAGLFVGLGMRIR